MLGDWTEKLKAIHALSVTHPYEILSPGDNPIKFREELENLLQENDNDYWKFVIPMAPPDDNSTLAVLIRCSYKQYRLALMRFSAAYTQAMRQPDTLANVWTYYRHLIIPSHNIYHNTATGLTLLADLPHTIFMRGVYEHLWRLMPDQKQSMPTPENVRTSDPAISSSNATHSTGDDPLTNFPILMRSRVLNDLLNYMTEIASYPIVPPDLSGFLVPSTVLLKGWRALNYMDPGLDSRFYVQHPCDSRPCVSCKIDNLAVGFTDITEQVKRTTCICVLSDTVYDTSAQSSNELPFMEACITTKGTMIARAAMIECPRCELSCPHHPLVAEKKYTDCMKVLASARYV